MKRSRLRNKFLNSKSDIDRKAYNAQRNLCISLIRQANKADKNAADVFNDFFINIVPNLKIEMDHNCNLDFQRTGDPVLDAINKYKCDSSIAMIKSKIDKQLKFSFTPVHEDILRKIKSLKVSKASQQSDIPTRILIDNSKYFASYFHENLNYCLGESLLFPHDLKLADVTPAYKKKSRSSKDNY